MKFQSLKNLDIRLKLILVTKIKTNNKKNIKEKKIFKLIRISIIFIEKKYIKIYLYK